jgi:Mycobacterium membrane protein
MVGRRTSVNAKVKRRNTNRILGKLWAPAVILAVLAIAGYGVNTVRGMSANISHPPVTSTIPATVIQINPKNVTYEAFGDLGGGGRVTYADLDSQPIVVTLASLPWSISETTMSPSATLSMVMQVDGDAAGCRILVNGKVRDEHLVSHPSAAVACTVTAA